MSFWQENDVEAKITAILSNVPEQVPDHHMGIPYLTAYQIAIEFEQRHPEVVEKLALPIGGQGIGQRTSLAQYLARELSRRINSGNISHIEGGYLSNLHLNDISFNQGDHLVRSSLTGTQYTLSMFRLRP